MHLLEKDLMTVNMPDSKTLYGMGRDLSLPFSCLLSDGSQLYCQKILRVLPKKRLTLKGQWQDKAVVVKIFIDKKRAKKHAIRDKQGIESVKKYQCYAPDILFFGQAKQPHVWIVVYEYIAAAQKLKTYWEQLSDASEKIKIIEKMTKLLATQHANGLMQTDLHLNNFLFKRGKIYCLDGDGIRCKKIHKALSMRKSLRNLAIFTEHLNNYTDAHVKHIFSIYATYRHLDNEQKYFQRFLTAIDAVRHRIHKKQMAKTLRDCSSFVAQKSARAFYVYDRRYQQATFIPFLQNPALFFEESEAVCLKAGNSTSVIKVQIADEIFVVKRYNTIGLCALLKYMFGKTRARRSWLNAHYLQLLKINTAAPIAFYEEKRGFFQGKSYFISRYQAGERLDKLFESQAQRLLWPVVLPACKACLEKLHSHKLVHADFKLHNLLFYKNKLFLLDLDSMKKYHKLSKFLSVADRDSLRLMKDLKKHDAVYAEWQALGF